MKSSTKKYFNSDKKFNKRIKKLAAGDSPYALPTNTQTTTLQAIGNQEQALQQLEESQIQQQGLLQQEQIQEVQEAQQQQQERTTAAAAAVPGALTTAGKVSSEAAEQIAKLGVKGAKVAGKGFAKTSTAVAPVALAATLAGEGIKYFSADDDNTKYNAGEIAGGLLSSAGQGASYGALLGSIAPGLGNVAGAVIGALSGLTIGGVKMLINRRNAREGQELEDNIKNKREEDFALRNTDLFNQATGVQGRDLGYNIGSSAANSYLPGFQRAEAGGKKVPGGVIKPLPFGAVEFRGNKHGQSGKGSNSGIILEEGGKSSPGVEVEDKETMDNVMFSNGKEDDYIFSSYLKLGGKSFAQMHKEILQSGGDQQQIQTLAKMQEEKAKQVKKTPVGPTDQYGPRGQEYIAKYGGVRKKFQAGMGPIAGRQSNYNSSMVRPIEEMAAYQKAMGNDSFWYKFKRYNVKDFFKDEVVEFPKTFQQLDSAKYSVPLNIPQPTPQPKQFGGRMKAQASISPEQVAPYAPPAPPSNAMAPYSDEGFRFDPATTDLVRDTTTATEPVPQPAATTTPTPTDQNTSNLPEGLEWMYDKDGNSIVVSVDEVEIVEKEKKEEKSEDPVVVPKELPTLTPPKIRDVPPLAYLGTAAQMLGPLMALNTEYSDDIRKISAGMQEKERLGRVNFNAERAANLNSSTAANKFIQNTNAGPAAIAAMMASNDKARQQSMEIASQEARQNMQLSNAEKQINANIVAQNLARNVQAQGFNAAAENEIDRLEYEKRIQAFNALGDSGTQLALDVMQYKAGEREARANQIAGEYSRNQYVEAMQNRPKYKKMLREAGVDPKDTRTVQRIAAAMYNPNMTLEEQEKMFREILLKMEENKKQKDEKRYGGYIGKYGSVKSKVKK
jgi:hypothetical protein